MRKSIWAVLCTVIAVMTILASCGGPSPVSTVATTVTSTVSNPTSTTAAPAPSAAAPATTTSAAPTTGGGRAEIRPPSTTEAATKDKPQYGGTLTVVENVDITRSFDPYRMGYGTSRMIGGTVLEDLGIGNWAKSPGGTNEFSFSGYYIPLSMTTGDLAESWEVSADGKTITMHLRKGVRWQNKAPVNGREFVADDVKYCWDRRLGIGSGFTKQTPYFYEGMTEIKSITVKDKYTVTFNTDPFSYVVLDFILQGYYTFIYPPEVIKQYGDMEDWKNVVGTGAFMLTDYVANSSATLKRNPDYYRKDELHPENQLPYLDEIRRLVIVDASTQIAAIRSYKADLFYYRGVDDYQKADLIKTMPDLQFGPGGSGRGYAVGVRMSVKPFTDLRVRQALQIGTNVPEMTNIITGKAATSYTSWMNSDYGESGGYIPFDKLPQDVKDLYTYNPTKAKQLLADAGYPNGLSTEIWVNKDDDNARWEVLQSQWKQIGVDLKIVLKDPALIQTAGADQSYTALLSSEMGAVSAATAYRSLESDVVKDWNTPEGQKALQMWTDAKSTVDDTQRVAKLKDLNIYLLRQVSRIPIIVVPVPYSVGQSWVGGWYGTHQLRKHEAGTVWTRLWIDQVRKAAVTGR